MHNIATETLDHAAEFPMPLNCAVRLEQRDNREIWRQFTDLLGSSRRTDQEVFVGAIDFAECPHDVSRIGTNSEFGGTPNIDRNLHGLI